MTNFVYANNVSTTLAAATTSAMTTLTLASATNLPTLMPGYVLPLTLNDAATRMIYEVVYVTAITGTTLTVMRAQEGTAAQNWAIGDYAFSAVTAGAMNALRTGGFAGWLGYSASTMLTNAVANFAIQWYGTAAGGTLTLPHGSTMQVASSLTFYNNGAYPMFVTTQGADVIYGGTGQDEQPVMIAQGGSLVLVNRGVEWDIVGGTAEMQFMTGAGSGLTGDSRNLVMNIPAASYTATMTADEIVVKTALGYQGQTLAMFDQTINLATTGAGGMDTGAPPDNGYVALYAIFNPTTGASALLATNATTTVAPSVYAGGFMPSGYTASALVSVWPTSTTGEFIAANQIGRTVSRYPVNVLTLAANAPTATELSISAAVPMNAKSISGWGFAGNNTSSTGLYTLQVAGTPSMIGYQQIGFAASAAVGIVIDGTFAISILTPQTIYYMTESPYYVSYSLTVSTYTI